MKDQARVNIIKKLFLLLGCIILIFAVINLIWFGGYKSKYNSIAKHLDEAYIFGVEEDDMLRFTKEVGDYTVTLKMPEYLELGGFVTVGKTEGYTAVLDDKNQVISGSGLDISLYIWPKVFSGYKLGLDFYDEYNDIWEQVEVSSNMEMLNIDNFDNEYIAYIEQLITENQEDIEQLIHIAEDTLEISIGSSE